MQWYLAKSFNGRPKSAVLQYVQYIHILQMYSYVFQEFNNSTFIQL